MKLFVDANGDISAERLIGDSGRMYGVPSLIRRESEAAYQAMLEDGISEYTPPPSPPKAVSEVAVDALDRINAACTALFSDQFKRYPAVERESWPYQRAEAEAFAADPLAPTPFLDRMAIARGIDRLVLIAKVQTKVAAMELSADAFGLRQRLEDQIDAVVADMVMTDDEKRAALNLVQWPAP